MLQDGAQQDMEVSFNKRNKIALLIFWGVEKLITVANYWLVTGTPKQHIG